MSPEELEAALDVVEWGERTKVAGAKSAILAHVAALEKERDAALADNATLLRIAKSRRCEAGPEAAMLGCEDCTALRGPHLGAALLEEHRKALETAHSDGRRRAMLQMLDRLGMDSACMYGDPEATDTRLSDELWNHVRWLEVRARNEGREAAAAFADEYQRLIKGLDAFGPKAELAVAAVATGIRSRKEPESA